MADRLEQETAKYAQVKMAVNAAEAELREIYEIEKAAASLVALLEAQQAGTGAVPERDGCGARKTGRRDRYASRGVRRRGEDPARAVEEGESSEYESSSKERNAAEDKLRQREQEEWKYAFQREKHLAEEQRQHELARLDREIQLKKEHLEKVLSEREQAVAAAEAELQALRSRAESFPGELDQAVSHAVQEAAERLERERKYAVDLLQKEFAGRAQRAELAYRIAATCGRQTDRTDRQAVSAA